MRIRQYLYECVACGVSPSLGLRILYCLSHRWFHSTLCVWSLIAMASNLLAMASNLEEMASNLIVNMEIRRTNVPNSLFGQTSRSLLSATRYGHKPPCSRCTLNQNACACCQTYLTQEVERADCPTKTSMKARAYETTSNKCLTGSNNKNLFRIKLKLN